MKKTLSELLSPDHSHYSSLGELAATLRMLIASSVTYRDPGRWGGSGPYEVLINHGGCVNSLSEIWESNRMTMGSQPVRVTTWQENHDAVYACILEAICTTGGAFGRWQSEQGVSLHMPVKIPMAYQRNTEERAAWKDLETLHKSTIAGPSLNNCHRRVNFLTEPQLNISASGVFITASVTQKSEFKTGPCYSRWDYGFLTGRKTPFWTPQRETFAKFILRAVEHFKTPNPGRTRNY